MKKVFLTVLLASAGLWPQALHRLPDCYEPFQVQGGGRVVTIDNRNTACSSWTLAYASSGFSSVSVEADQAADSAGQPGSWNLWSSGAMAGGASFPLTNLAQAQASFYGYTAWIGVNISVTGSGTLSGVLYGYRASAGQDANANGPTPQSVSVSSLPALPAGANSIGSVQQSGTWNVNLHDSSGAAVSALQNTALNVAAGGTDAGNNYAYFRVDAWNADGQSGNLKGPITWSRLSANASASNSSWDNLRTGSADGGSKVGQLEITRAYNATTIETATTTTIKATTGILHRIVVNTGSAGATVKLYNVGGSNCSGTPAGADSGVITLPATLGNPFFLDYDQVFSNGICVVTSAAMNITVVAE